MKKLKGKYAEQDEEDRALVLELLGSAGKSKRQIKQEELAKAQAAKAEEAEAREARKRLRQQREMAKEAELERQRAAGRAEGRRGDRSAQGEGGTGGGKGDRLPRARRTRPTRPTGWTTSSSLPSWAQLLQEPSIALLPEARRALLCAQDTLTSQPAEGDELLYALPVCAPYSVLSAYTYKIAHSGNQKRARRLDRQA